MPLVVFRKTIDVACAPSRVYGELAKPGDVPGWQPWRASLASLGPSGARMAHTLLGLRFVWTARAVEEPGRALGFAQVDGDFEALEGTWEVAPFASGEGARVTLTLRIELPFVLPRLVTEEEFQRDVSRRLDEALLDLKARLEEGARPGERPGAGLARFPEPAVPLRVPRAHGDAFRPASG